MASHKSIKKHRKVSRQTQTEISLMGSADVPAEIARLQEINKILQIENARLRAHIDSGSIQQLTVKDENEVELTQMTEANSPSEEEIAKIRKGCSCKGHCQSKQCGCVKKNSSCNDSCKCNKSACHNQNDTQNVNLVKKRTKSKILKSIERPLNEQINNKNAEHLYSPNSLENMFDKFSDLDFENITTKINVERMSSSDSDNVFTPNKDLNKENESHVQTKRVGVQTRRRGKLLSVPSEDKRQVRSSLNQKALSKSESQVDETNRRTTVSSEIHVGTKQNPDSDIKEPNSSNDQELKETFNPLVPRHQIPRSPPGHNNMPVPSSSNAYVLEPVPKVQESLPIPEEINEPIVDWAKHQTTLVPCQNCNRKFFRHRVEVHEASCKKI